MTCYPEPTFRILFTIEALVSLSIQELHAKALEKQLTEIEMSIISSCAPNSTLSQEDIAVFLGKGLYASETKTKNTAALEWDKIIPLALNTLCLPPEEFWHLTPLQFQAMLNNYHTFFLTPDSPLTPQKAKVEHAD